MRQHSGWVGQAPRYVGYRYTLASSKNFPLFLSSLLAWVRIKRLTLEAI